MRKRTSLLDDLRPEDIRMLLWWADESETERFKQEFPDQKYEPKCTPTAIARRNGFSGSIVNSVISRGGRSLRVEKALHDLIKPNLHLKNSRKLKELYKNKVLVKKRSKDDSINWDEIHLRKNLIGVQIEDRIVILTLHGNLTGYAVCRELRNILKKQSALDFKNVIIDFSRLRLINSLGMGMIVSCYLHLKKINGNLKLVQPNDNVRFYLTISKLDSVFDIYESIDTAKETFQTLLSPLTKET